MTRIRNRDLEALRRLIARVDEPAAQGQLQALFHLISTGEKFARQLLAQQQTPHSSPLTIPPFIPVPVEVRKEQLNRYYNDKANEIRAFFIENRHTVALTAFDFWCKQVEGQIRRDGYTPEIAHVIDQLLPLITSLTKEDGMLRDSRDVIERMHGPIELWFLSITLHDAGEDKNVKRDRNRFQLDVRQSLTRRLQNREKRNPTEEEKQLIAFACQAMEILTHYRKIPIAEAEHITKQKIDLSGLSGERQVINLAHLIPAFQKRMGALEIAGFEEKIQVYAIKDKRGEPSIIVTRYGMEENSGIDWNLYLQAVTMFHIYVALTKMGDRVQGLSSRIAIRPFDVGSYATYQLETECTFLSISPPALLRRHHADSPLLQVMESVDQQMRLLHALGGLVVRHHPQSNKEGGRGFSPGNIVYNHVIETSPLYLSCFFPAAEDFYRVTPPISHPTGQFMRQLGDTSEAAYKNLFEQIYIALCEEGGPDIQTLLEGVFGTPETPAMVAVPSLQ